MMLTDADAWSEGNNVFPLRFNVNINSISRCEYTLLGGSSQKIFTN